MITTIHNGNVLVSIFEDGTKIREYEGDPQPVYPESIDIKITDYCDLGCPFCHEDSTLAGKHADIDVAINYVSQLPAGTELAIGGGNPLAHPHVLRFLTEAKRHGIICNMTVNERHVEPFRDLIYRLLDEKLIYGLGISGVKPQPELYARSPNVVHHVIMGVHRVEQVKNLPKVLVLGYKLFRRGVEFYSRHEVDKNRRVWYTEIVRLFGRQPLSFDNLAIRQLNLRRFFTQEEWDSFYMGDDGQFTMYVDAVNQVFARSSTSDKRSPLSSIAVDFSKVRNEDCSNQ